MRVEAGNETIVIVIVFIVVSIPFLLLIVVNYTIGFEKINEFLAKLKRKDKIYTQIRDLLREKLIPLGFTEEESVKYGNEAVYIRNGFLVELYFDMLERRYSFFVSSGVQNLIFPPRQVSVIFFSAKEIEEKRGEIVDALDEWLKSIGS